VRRLIDLAIEVASMDGSRMERYEPLSEVELAKVTRGSMAKVFDPEGGVWYWVVIERRLKDGRTFVGRIDAHCLLGPTLRHGGAVAFDQDNILQVWPNKVDTIFDKLWFRFFSHLLSMGAGVKALKRPETR
jgi:hypothetical protein